MRTFALVSLSIASTTSTRSCHHCRCAEQSGVFTSLAMTINAFVRDCQDSSLSTSIKQLPIMSSDSVDAVLSSSSSLSSGGTGRRPAGSQRLSIMFFSYAPFDSAPPALPTPDTHTGMSGTIPPLVGDKGAPCCCCCCHALFCVAAGGYA